MGSELKLRIEFPNHMIDNGNMISIGYFDYGDWDVRAISYWFSTLLVEYVVRISHVYLLLNMVDVILYDSFQKWRYPEILSLDHFSIETRINGHFRNPNRRYLPYMRPFFEGSISWDIPPNDGLKKYMAKI